eukprot:sb/3475542/
MICDGVYKMVRFMPHRLKASASYSAQFLILLVSSLLMVLGVALSTCVLIEIEPGKDSLVYKTSARAKVSQVTEVINIKSGLFAHLKRVVKRITPCLLWIELKRRPTDVLASTNCDFGDAGIFPIF